MIQSIYAKAVTSERGITETVTDGIHRYAVLTQRTVVRLITCIIRQITGGVECSYRDAVDLFAHGIDG